MRVQVKLYGTWRGRFPNYRHSQGIEVEVPDGARVKDLLARLNIPQSQGALVILDGRVLRADEPLRGGIQVDVLQAVGGG